jgi:hypothetical protein
MAKRFECPTGKRRFKDHEQAVDVLHKAAAARNWAKAEKVRTNREEVRTYRCARCKGFHLTSQAEWITNAA